ncbi:MAG: septal ring lytic transglycosylase RlpA family protein [Treponema sp.]|jgi:rare lipoprotein A|nr:septal ring lytic transglycosylase RlpA family protein [Treponema sp.]
MKRIALRFILTFAAAVSIPAQTAGWGAPEETAQGYFRQDGVASWYGAGFEGRLTASGEIFDSSKFTAAHPILPFGTMLKITNKYNDRSVTVRVNDRGPYVANRIIDLSRAAAEELDMIKTGTAPVIVESLTIVTLPIRKLTTVPTGADGQPSRSLAPVQMSSQPPAPPEFVVPAETAAAQPVQPVQPPRPAQAVPPYVPPPQYVASPRYAAPPPAEPPRFTEPARAVQENQNVDLTDPSRPRIEQMTDSPSFVFPGPGAEDNGPAQTGAAPAEPYSAVMRASVKAPPPLSGRAAETPGAAQFRPAIPEGPAAAYYRVQVGAYKQPRNAMETFERLKKAGLNPAYEKYDDYYRVVLANLRREELSAVAERLGQAGFSEVILREEQ